MTFNLEYVEEMTQKRLALSAGELVPLGFDDLAALHGKLREPIAFPLRIRGARVVSTEFDHLHTAEKLNVKAELQSHLGSTVLGLVKGGWLPSGLILDEDTLLLPDRCTVAALRSRFVGGEPKEGVPPDFLDFARDKALKVNPMLYAMEGTSGSRNPDAAELSALYDRAALKIGEALPKAVMFPHKEDALQGVLGLLQDAFNALADLRALDLLIAAGTDFPDKRVALLTEDRALALYWVGMQTHSHRRDGTSIHYAMNPHTAMFARLSDQEVQAVLRMLADDGKAPD
jgi:hypothetical protein